MLKTNIAPPPRIVANKALVKLKATCFCKPINALRYIDSNNLTPSTTPIIEIAYLAVSTDSSPRFSHDFESHSAIK